jgi:hypothetical protein
MKIYGMKDAFKCDFIYKYSWKDFKNMPIAFSTTKRPFYLFTFIITIGKNDAFLIYMGSSYSMIIINTPWQQKW